MTNLKSDNLIKFENKVAHLLTEETRSLSSFIVVTKKPN